jgi:curved DNA-binding protein CbpA
MQYHPDRNNGRESEVTSRFQAILEAHEVLKDPTQRQKYDNDRASLPAFQKNKYQSGGNQRGNPWANVSSQYPPPPKPPTARANRAPPPSAGAQRYSKFETPKQSANATAQEGADARRSTYEAWENMRNGRAQPSSGPAPKQSRPPNARPPGFDEFRTNYNAPGGTPRRAQSSSASNRKGFVPNTPGGDESPAPRGAYFTTRKPAQAPPPPPRNHPNSQPTNNDVPVDPLRQFRNQPDVQFETRHSTPYASHGGEKFDPFGGIPTGQRLDPDDTSNLNRSKSTREPRMRTDEAGEPKSMPRAGSDSNLNSPQNGQPFSPRRTQHSFTTTKDSDSSSSDDGPEISSRRFAKPRGQHSGVNSPPTRE